MSRGRGATTSPTGARATDRFASVLGTRRGLVVVLPSGHALRLPDHPTELEKFVREHAGHDGFRAVRGDSSVPGQPVPAAPAALALLCCFDHKHLDDLPTHMADLRETEALFQRLGIEFDTWPPPRDEWSRWP